MGVEVRGKSDKGLQAVAAVLAAYERDHRDARVTLYRHAPCSVRIRVVDPDFAEMSRAERNNLVWNYLDELPEDEQSDVNMLLLITPDEIEKSFGSLEFEDPVPSVWESV